MNIGNIQIGQAIRLSVQPIDSELSKAGGVLAGGRRNAFLLLLNGISEVCNAEFTGSEASQFGQRMALCRRPVGQGKGNDQEKKRSQASEPRGLEPVLSPAGAPGSLIVAQAPPSITRSPVDVKSSFPVSSNWFGANIDRASSVAPLLTAAAPGKSLADLAFALHISPKSADHQNEPPAAERIPASSQPDVELGHARPVQHDLVFTSDPAQGSPANSVAVVSEPASHRDSWPALSPFVQGRVNNAPILDASKSESPLPATFAHTATSSDGNNLRASQNTNEIPVRSSLIDFGLLTDGNSGSTSSKEAAPAPLDSWPIPEGYFFGNPIQGSERFVQSTLHASSGRGSPQLEDSSPYSKPSAIGDSHANVDMSGVAQTAASEKIQPVRQAPSSSGQQEQANGSTPKDALDAIEGRGAAKKTGVQAVKQNIATLAGSNLAHENKPEGFGMIARGSGNTSGDAGYQPAPMRSASAPDLPSQAQAKDPVSQPARQISFKLAGPATSNVNVLFTEKAGKVEVAVRTPDQNLTKSLQSDLGDLVARLNNSGLKTEAWIPTAAHHAPPSPPSNSANSQGHQPGNSGLWSGNQQQQRERNESNQRQQPRWMAQFDESVSAEDMGVDKQ